MPEGDKRSNITEFLNKKQNLKWIIPIGLLVGLIILYLIFAQLLSGPSVKRIKMAKEAERVSADLTDYWDGLSQTKNDLLKNAFEKGLLLYETGEYVKAKRESPIFSSSPERLTK